MESLAVASRLWQRRFTQRNPSIGGS